MVYAISASTTTIMTYMCACKIEVEMCRWGDPTAVVSQETCDAFSLGLDYIPFNIHDSYETGSTDYHEGQNWAEDDDLIEKLMAAPPVDNYYSDWYGEDDQGM